MPGFVSINTPPATSALTTISNAKLDINLSTSTDDSLINLLINRCSAVINNYCGRPLGLQSLTETFRHAYGQPFYNNPYPPAYGVQQVAVVRPLLLTYIPVVSVTSVVEDSVTLVSGTDYEADTKTGQLWRLASSARVSWTGQTVVATYSAGYVLPQDTGTRTLPIEIEDACLTMVRSSYFNRGHDPSVILELVEGVGRTAYSPTNDSSASVLESVKLVLAPYRSVVW